MKWLMGLFRPKTDLLRVQVYDGRDWETLEVNYGSKDRSYL
jgi:hypothetical protein